MCFEQKNNIILEVKWFLATLKSHSKLKLNLDKNSLNELAAIVSNISTLIGDANIISAENGMCDDWEFYRQIGNSDDWEYLRFDHFITCRICHVSP